LTEIKFLPPSRVGLASGAELSEEMNAEQRVQVLSLKLSAPYPKFCYYPCCLGPRGMSGNRVPGPEQEQRCSSDWGWWGPGFLLPGSGLLVPGWRLGSSPASHKGSLGLAADIHNPIPPSCSACWLFYSHLERMKAEKKRPWSPNANHLCSQREGGCDSQDIPASISRSHGQCGVHRAFCRTRPSWSH
jgi:hypothetical protein